MKDFGKRIVFFLAAALLLAGTASANSAPPDCRVAVTVVNGPEEAYYLDLLEELSETVSVRDGKGPGGLDPALESLTRQAVPEGWQACTLSEDNSHSFSGDMAGENGVHIFHGWDMPREFRVLIVTASGESWVSEPLAREILNSSVRVDWEGKTVRITPKWVALGIQFLSTLIPTLVIEGLVLIAFGLASRRNWLVFLVVNLVTQGILSAMLALPLAQGGFGMLPFFLLFLIPGELVIAVVEANIYRHWFRGRSHRRAFWYGFAANGASYALGWVVVNLVWAGLISL